MPSWITHLATANKLIDKLEIKDKNSFLFGNIMPDILNNHIVKNTNVHRKYEITHFTDDVVINGIKHEFPNPNKFLVEYKDKISNPVICGFYIHLLTDYYWNKTSYEKYFKNNNGLVELKFVNGTRRKYEYDDAIKIKQTDFRIFTEYLKINNTIDKIVYSDNLLNLSKEIKETPLIEEDIYNTLYEVNNLLNNEVEQISMNYNLFTQDKLEEYFEQSIEFIIKEMKKYNLYNL